MALLTALGALAMLQGGAQLPASLLEAPVPTAPSASCAPGVPANQCLAAPTADTSGESDDENAAGQVLLSMDELVFFIRDVASFSPATASSLRYLPIVHAVMEEVQELAMITAIEELEEEVIPPSVTSHLLFKHWCRFELPPKAATTLCPRYLERLKKSEDGVWHKVHEQLQPAVGFLNRLLEVWSIRFKRQRTLQQGAADDDRRSPLRVVINGGGPAGLVNAVAAYTAGAESGTGHLGCLRLEEQDTHEKHSGNAGIIHVQCAELERFLSKVLHFLGVTVLGQRHGLGLCLAPPAAHDSVGEAWGWVSAPADAAVKYSSLAPSDLCSMLSATSSTTTGVKGWSLPDDWVVDVLKEGELNGTEFFYRRSNPTEIAWEPPRGATRATPDLVNASSPATSEAVATPGASGWQAPNGLMIHGVDLLIGADGSHSMVRGAVGVAFESQDTLVLPESAQDGRGVPQEARRRHSMRLDALDQTTLIAKFLQVPKLPSAKQSAISPKLIAAESHGSSGQDVTPLRCPPTRVVDERPREKVVGTGLIDPFYPGLVIDGVTSVFKRFFNDECELQVLLTDDFASSIWAYRTDSGISPEHFAREEERAEARAWQKLLEVANLLIVPHWNTSRTGAHQQIRGSTDRGADTDTMAYPTVEALKSALTPPGGQPPRLLVAADGSDMAHDPTHVGDTRSTDKAVAVTAQHTAVGAGLFRIEINLASTLAGIVPETALAEQLKLNEAGNAPARPMFALVGDAAVTAHYRLGVGVNHAFANVRDLSNLIRSLSPPGSQPLPDKVTVAAITQHNEALSRRAANLVQFQLFAMYFEAHCGLVVVKDQLYRHSHLTNGDMERLRSASLAMDECERRRGGRDRSQPR